jgi:nitrate/nitrite-specific signal transduction histidine kinase
VRDDGIGIPATILQQRGRQGHWGLTGMRERAERIGARFELWSREGSGTEIEIVLRRTAEARSDSAFARWRRWLTSSR